MGVHPLPHIMMHVPQRFDDSSCRQRTYEPRTLHPEPTCSCSSRSTFTEREFPVSRAQYQAVLWLTPSVEATHIGEEAIDGHVVGWTRTHACELQLHATVLFTATAGMSDYLLTCIGGVPDKFWSSGT